MSRIDKSIRDRKEVPDCLVSGDCELKGDGGGGRRGVSFGGNENILKL